MCYGVQEDRAGREYEISGNLALCSGAPLEKKQLTEASCDLSSLTIPIDFACGKLANVGHRTMECCNGHKCELLARHLNHDQGLPVYKW